MRHTLPLSLLVAGFVAAAPHAQDAALADVADALLEARMPSRDDADATAARLLELARANARSPTSALLIDFVGQIIDECDAPARVVDGLRAFLTLDDANGLGTQSARVLLRQALRVLGDDEGAGALEPFADQATRWLAIGPFGDSGDFYGGVAFQPELRFPSPGERIEGRFGPVSSRVVERPRTKRGVELGPENASKKGCNYGLHQVRATRAVACFLEVQSGGSFEVFVDGERVRFVDRIAERTPGRVYVPVALSAGVHHVLVKTTLEDYDDVALRYVDARGCPTSSVEELEPDRVHAITSSTDGGPPRPAAFVDGLEALTRAARRGDAERRDVLEAAAMRVAFELGAIDVGNEFLFGMSQTPPSEPRLALALSESWRIARDVPQEIRDGEARRLLDAAAEQLPDHHLARMRRADVLRGDDRIEDAIRLVLSAVHDGHAGRATWEKLTGLYDALGARAEVERTRRAWLADHPLDVRPLSAIARTRADAGDPRGALDLIDAGLARLPGHPGLLAQARELAVELGDRERATALVERIQSDDPESLEALRARAGTRRELGDVDGAVALWRRCAARPDADAGVLRDVGLALWRAGARDAARDAFGRSLERRPSQHDLQRTVGRLAGAADDFQRISRFRASEREIDALVAGFQAGAREGGAPSTLLLDRMVVEFRPDGGYVQEVHQLRRINDLRGVEAHEEATAAARADEVVRLRTIGADGASYVPKRVSGSFAMPRLQPGAFVEELWRETTAAPEAEPWRGPSFLFRGQDEAFLHTEFVMILPPGHPGEVRARGYPADPDRIPLDAGYEALRFTRTDVPRLRPEKLTPPIEELVPVVTYGEDRAPGERARLTRIAAVARTRITPPVTKVAAAIVEGVQGDSARALAIHRWVHDNIANERGSPDPTATLLRKQGPRFFLEVALLRAADVPLRDVAVAAESEVTSDAAPALFVGDVAFDVPAALVQPRDGAASWLFSDLPRHAPLGLIAAARAGAPALMADDGEVVRIPAATEGAPGWRVTGELTIAENGDADLDVRMELHDAPGYALAQQIRDLDANRRQLVGRSLGAQLFEGWTVLGSELLAPEPGQRFAAKLQLRRRGALQPTGDVLQLPLPLPPSQMFQRYGDAGPRELPMRQSGSTLEDWDLVVDPGSMHRLASLPQDLRIADALLDFTLTFRREDGKVHVQRRVALRPGTVQPARFAEWVHLLRSADRAEEARIEFVRR